VSEVPVRPQRVGLSGYAVDAEDTEMPDIMQEKFPAALAVIGMDAFFQHINHLVISCLCLVSREYIAELCEAQRRFIFLCWNQPCACPSSYRVGLVCFLGGRHHGR